MYSQYQYPTTLEHLWHDTLTCLKADPQCDLADFFPEDSLNFLASIGLSVRELRNYATDYLELGDPDFLTIMLLCHLRRAYFLEQQQSQVDFHRIELSEFPDKHQELGGIEGLALTTAKAAAWLKDELPKPLRFLDTPDRELLKRIDLHPADFLRWVWDAEGEFEILAARISWHMRRLK